MKIDTYIQCTSPSSDSPTKNTGTSVASNACSAKENTSSSSAVLHLLPE